MRFLKLVFSFLILILFTAIINLGFAQSPDQNTTVITAEIEGEIRAGTTQYVKRSLNQAQDQNADLFLLNLNTPGGLLKPTEEISRLLLESKIKTAVFVHKEGGWAFSAGSFILLSADVAAVHPDSSIGAAQPRLFGVGEATEPDEKIINASASWIKSLALAKNRNEEVAEKFVRENLTLSGREAVEQNVIDFYAQDQEEFLTKVDLGGATVITVNPTILENILSFLSIPQIVSLFFTIGALGVVLIFRTGEFESLSVLAVVAFLLGLWGIGAVSLSAVGIALLVVGIAFLLIEIFNPGFGIFGAVGIVSLLAGILLFGQEPYTSSTFAKPTTFFVLGAAAASATIFLIVGRITAKTLHAKPQSGMEALIGKRAQVTETLDPVGRIILDNESWRAKSIDITIKKGEEVKIVDFAGNTLFVKGAGK